MLADRGRAGEADLADDAAGDEGFADEAGLAMYELGDAVGDPGVGERTEQFGADARRLVRRARDHRAAGRQRCADLLRQQVDREIPRRERCRRPDRLTDHAAELAGGTNEGAAIVALRVLGVPVEQLCRRQRLELGLGERLTLLLGHGRGDQIGAFTQQLRGLVEDRAAFLDIHCAPFGPGSFGSSERLFEVGFGRVGDLGDRLCVHRVDDRVRVAAFARFPHAVDEELEVGFVSHARPDRLCRGCRQVA